MLELFTRLTGMLYAGAFLAILSSFIWGIISILLSPCHLASIPLLVGFINGTPDINRKKAFTLSLVFSTGILITIALIGIITGTAGRILGDTGYAGKLIPAVLMILFGLYLAEFIKLPFMNFAVKPAVYGKGHISSFIMGLVFGIALGPCSFAFLAPLLGIVFSTANTDLMYSLSILAAYATGHCLVIVFAGTFTGVIRQILRWNETSGGVILLKRICGVFVSAAGIYLLIS